MLDIVYHEVDIFLHTEQMEIFGMLPVLQSHTGAPYQLQLMHLQGSERQTGQYAGLCHDAFVRLARQSEDDMPTGQDSARSGSFHRISGGMESMPAVDAAKCLVVGTLYAVLH